MRICESREHLRVGMMVRTNGDSNHYRTSFINGYIGEITSSSFYVWQNTHEGTMGCLDPMTLGYRYSWQINFDGNMGEVGIEIGEYSFSFEDMSPKKKLVNINEITKEGVKFLYDDIEFYIGEINDDGMFVWSNDRRWAGATGRKDPLSKGYEFSYKLYPNDTCMMVELLDIKPKEFKKETICDSLEDFLQKQDIVYKI